MPLSIALTETEELAELRLRIQKLACDRIEPFVSDSEALQVIRPEIRSAMAEEGCFGRTLPVEYGGSGDTAAAFAVQQCELSKVWPTAAVAATWTNLSGSLVNKFGSTEHKAELLPGAAAGAAMGAVAWTEPRGGSDAAGIATSARRVEGGWVLNGSKRLIDNIARADFVIVGARSDPDAVPRHGLSMFVVRRSDPGFEFGGVYDTLGLRAAGVGWFELNDCFVPDDRLLGKPGRGFHQMMAMVEIGRIGVAAICLGMTTAALNATVEFLSDRHSFGGPLSANDAILAKIADLRVRLDAAQLLTDRAISMYDSGIRCTTESAMAKLAASELSNDATAAALHLHGGIGFTTETPVLRLFRDSQAFTIGEGTSEILRMIVGRDEFAKGSRP
ncbi:acyl-CoA/acyl-ACP dehydrogenase [Gordonia sp. zg691]|uniref:acyl-CoA dehydrogenase family protein n=1 Tax=Gordonia jinghuaiqii TaxID=2758710 RepID=UPI0016627A61|nr:acyl-CoA dehydrogenase family protein [Gordonia jinghuaiqii]MBD0859785.1 acyl-CoA/acyl-ACP dehydrogenase [Gordonia jinghuaiqii]